MYGGKLLRSGGEKEFDLNLEFRGSVCFTFA